VTGGVWWLAFHKSRFIHRALGYDPTAHSQQQVSDILMANLAHIFKRIDISAIGILFENDGSQTLPMPWQAVAPPLARDYQAFLHI